MSRPALAPYSMARARSRRTGAIELEPRAAELSGVSAHIRVDMSEPQREDDTQRVPSIGHTRA
jgi:hypothetical protein